MATDTDIAWCAGFFDGEGHVSYRRQINPKTMHVSPMLQASVPQNSDNIEVLQFFQSVIGFGNLRGPYKMPDGSPQHRLLFGTKEVMELLIILKPYLKREKTLGFQMALLAYMDHNPKANEEDIAKMVKRAKKKGCLQCGFKWNGVVCSSCGYVG